MRNLYIIIINALLFFFVVKVVNGVIIRDGILAAVIIAALIFGALMLSVPAILKFFKMNVNIWSKILLSIVLSFIFFFMVYNGVLGIGSIGRSEISLGLGIGSALVLDSITTLIFVSVVSGLSSAGLDWLAKS
jgi:hypothetical protein